MTKNSVKEKRVTIRLTNSRHSELTTYAKAHETSLSQAIEDLVDAGLKAEHVRVATKEDIELLMSKQEASNLAIVQAIKSQPIVVQQLPPVEEEHQDDTKRPGLFKRLFKG